MTENLKKIEMFFDYNLSIKQLMHDALVKDEDFYNEESIIDYEDKTFKILEEIKYNFLKILKLYNNNEKNINKIEEKFKFYKENLFNSIGDKEKLKKFYKDNISNMREEFLDSINNNCIGYYLTRNSTIIEPETINEYLHFLHSSIINNENIYQNMPKIAYKGKSEFHSVNLYGKEDEMAYSFFENFPIEEIESRVDILNLDDRILIMARDLGHALMVEITKDKEKPLINYFVPKVCNYLKVNELKGVKKVNKESKYARGKFEVEISNMNKELYDFFMKVPTDADMFIYGGSMYEEKII